MEDFVANYDELKVGEYVLPNCIDNVKNAFDWQYFHRPNIINQFKKIMYGNVLPTPDGVQYKILTEKTDALNGKAIRREVEITFSMNNGKSHSMIMLVYIPKKIKTPAPVFVGLTFGGNHITTLEDDVIQTGLLSPEWQNYGRGKNARRFIFEEVIDRGYASATLSYHDIFPDNIDGWKDSIFKLFYSQERLQERLDEYSTIGAWAWGLSRMLDALGSMKEIDITRAAVHGHSRLGKTALWAGVLDERFKLVCVNDSGCGGAALSRRNYGETLWSMVAYHKVGYWFAKEIEKYIDDFNSLPIDQHMLISLVAPRAISVHSATLDNWADPKGEYLSLYHAQKVYELFGVEPKLSAEHVEADVMVGDELSYMYRTGEHDQIREDWMHYLQLADKFL